MKIVAECAENRLKLHLDTRQWGMAIAKSQGGIDSALAALDGKEVSILELCAFIPNPSTLEWKAVEKPGLGRELVAIGRDYSVHLYFPANPPFFTDEGVIGDFVDTFGDACDRGNRPSGSNQIPGVDSGKR